ncbi:hypothetical protein R4642_10085 [Acinetobacter baumannii]|nr:hypothetical protein [Acinetobacter baumannii]
MINLNQELEDFDAYFFKRHGELPLDSTSEEYANKSYLKHEMFKAWKARAKAQAVPDTHVLVEKSKISTWWQDADEPENFANTTEQLFEMISESEIYTDDMLVVEKHVQAQLSTQKLYCVYQITNKETGVAEIKLCESRLEAQEILNNNAKWIAEKEADQYESMNAFFDEEDRKSGAEQ